MIEFSEEELDIINNWEKYDGGQFISVISPITGFSYITPVNFLYYENKFYTSTDKRASKIKFIKKGSDKASILISINGSNRKPYIGIIGTVSILELNSSNFQNSNRDNIHPQILSWLANKNRYTIEMSPIRIYGKTRGAL